MNIKPVEYLMMFSPERKVVWCTSHRTTVVTLRETNSNCVACWDELYCFFYKPCKIMTQEWMYGRCMCLKQLDWILFQWFVVSGCSGHSFAFYVTKRLLYRGAKLSVSKAVVKWPARCPCVFELIVKCLMLSVTQSSLSVHQAHVCDHFWEDLHL